MKPQTFKPKKGIGGTYKSVSYMPSRDPKLSAKAKGILYYLLFKPDNWVGQLYDITQHCADTEYSIKQGVKELVQAGYLKQKHTKMNGKFVGSHYIYSDKPNLK